MQRWWDDQSTSRAALELVDGSDPQRGMGVAVLGFHGIAKAVLAPLAGTTLVDPRTMADALSEADFQDVEDAIFTLASDDLGQVAASKYAELVVEDMRRATIESSVRLSQTLVNKGMPWPRAITRVAEVAGVPLTALGRYASQVAAPGLDALAVTDYADRALMEHARARAALESEWSTVSKARVRMRQAQREPFNEAEVNRDELGRFAEEHRASAKEQEELEARRARRRKRKKAKARKTTKLVPTGRTATQAVTDRTARPLSSNRPTHSNRPIRPEDRPKAGEPTGSFGLPVVSLNRLSEHKGPVTVSQPMYVFQDVYDTEAEAAGFMSRAYTEEDKDAVLGEMAATMNIDHVPKKKLPRIVVHRFEPGALVIQEKVGPNDDLADLYERSANITTYLTFVPGLSSGVDVVFRPRGPKSTPVSIFATKPPRNARSVISVARARDSEEYSHIDANGITPVQVVNVDSEMVEFQGLWEDVSMSFTKAARVRYRQQQREPWDESSVNRDELGRFAEEEKATEAELAAIAERKARRRRRKHAKDRRAKFETERRTQAQSQQQRVEHVQQERTAVPGQRAVPRPTQRAQRRTEMAPEVRAAVQEPLRIKVRGHQAHQAKAWMREGFFGHGDRVFIGSRDPLTQYDLALTRELTYPVERASLLKQAKALFDRRQGIVDSTDLQLADVYELSSYPEVRVLYALRQFSKDLSAARPHPHPADAAKDLMLDGGQAFSNFLNDPQQRADARVFPTTPAWSQAVYEQNILHSGRPYVVTRILGPNGPKNEVYRGTASFDAPTAVIIITKKAAAVLDRLEGLTDPKNEYPKRGDTAYQKVMRTLRQNEIIIEKMPVNMLEDLADEALSRPDVSEVRLDAVDVFRVYVNGERDN